MKNWQGFALVAALAACVLTLGLPQVLRAETEHLGPRIVDHARYAIANHSSPDKPGVWLVDQHTGNVWFGHRDQGNWENMGTPSELSEQPDFMDEQPDMIDQP